MKLLAVWKPSLVNGGVCLRRSVAWSWNKDSWGARLALELLWGTAGGRRTNEKREQRGSEDDGTVQRCRRYKDEWIRTGGGDVEWSLSVGALTQPQVEPQ